MKLKLLSSGMCCCVIQEKGTRISKEPVASTIFKVEDVVTSQKIVLFVFTEWNIMKIYFLWLHKPGCVFNTRVKTNRKVQLNVVWFTALCWAAWQFCLNCQFPLMQTQEYVCCQSLCLKLGGSQNLQNICKKNPIIMSHKYEQITLKIWKFLSWTLFYIFNSPFCWQSMFHCALNILFYVYWIFLSGCTTGSFSGRAQLCK
jgi:hypothetical protein